MTDWRDAKEMLPESCPSVEMQDTGALWYTQVLTSDGQGQYEVLLRMSTKNGLWAWSRGMVVHEVRWWAQITPPESKA